MVRRSANHFWDKKWESVWSTHWDSRWSEFWESRSDDSSSYWKAFCYNDLKFQKYNQDDYLRYWIQFGIQFEDLTESPCQDLGEAENQRLSRYWSFYWYSQSKRYWFNYWSLFYRNSKDPFSFFLRTYWYCYWHIYFVFVSDAPPENGSLTVTEYSSEYPTEQSSDSDLSS